MCFLKCILLLFLNSFDLLFFYFSFAKPKKPTETKTFIALTVTGEERNKPANQEIFL